MTDTIHSITPAKLRKDLYKSIESVNENSVPLEINGKSDKESAVLITTTK
jgi:PHD/YefM family antitoxin component YafN of YafNO toxin-antitoxin module